LNRKKGNCITKEGGAKKGVVKKSKTCKIQPAEKKENSNFKKLIMEPRMDDSRGGDGCVEHIDIRLKSHWRYRTEARERGTHSMLGKTKGARTKKKGGMGKTPSQ